MESTKTIKLTVLAVITAVTFFLGLTLFEGIPEIPVDIDFKPFFIPMSFVALVPKGWPLFAVSLGAMLGEFLRDLLEGYEIDDPIGAVGYVVGFMAAGYLIGNHPLNKFLVAVGAIVAGFVHAAIEATAFIIFDEETFRIAVLAAIGNTITDGIILGAIPTPFIVPQLYGRIERYLGYAPRGKERRYRRQRQAHASHG
ncbi:hypothetical protein F7734_02380 [Scytonema sp. UIC 10036]|uniref:hypothetical protein n=1 Tax=Scytonema sp. UIC 10036 TaxID=2304196 RepID=UPI0012DAE6C3|nr:hypothetical protein [Scytonema sp. UIC 10036]MUG91396.1 hypothetical protein [Scytonema sp. UIC 10036]